MKEIRNVSKKPLRVPLPLDKVLHLGPLKTGQVPASALDHGPFKALVEAGEIEVLGEGSHDLPHPTKDEAKGQHGQSAATRNVGGVHPAGDR